MSDHEYESSVHSAAMKLHVIDHSPRCPREIYTIALESIGQGRSKLLLVQLLSCMNAQLINYEYDTSTQLSGLNVYLVMSVAVLLSVSCYNLPRHSITSEKYNLSPWTGWTLRICHNFEYR